MKLRWTVATMLVAATAAGAVLKAGAAKIEITPQEAIWMAGYAARKSPSEGVKHPLYARALALEDIRGARVVIVSTDLIGLPRSVTDVVAARAMKEFQLERGDLLFNSSHTHTGPVVEGNLGVMGVAQAEALGFGGQKRVVERYREWLEERLYYVIGAALNDLQPAKAAFAQGQAGFAMNRRQREEKPVDPSVPVLRVTTPEGKVLALLFGYACHNTTLTAGFKELSGDYAGYAASELERQWEGSTALFLQLCGGDQNPEPRSKAELAGQHGKTLAAEVARVARGPMAEVSGRLKTAFTVADLPFAAQTRAKFEAESSDKNEFVARRAKLMLKAHDNGTPVRRLQLPVQAIRFTKGFTLVALGGEVVVDYALWLKRENPKEPLMVAGYSNDVACYVPTVRILREGGYEADESMIYYGQPGPFTEEVEGQVQEAMRGVLRRVKQ